MENAHVNGAMKAPKTIRAFVTYCRGTRPVRHGATVILLSCIALSGLAGCASQVDREDRQFFYEGWLPSKPKTTQPAERDHEEIFREHAR